MRGSRGGRGRSTNLTDRGGIRKRGAATRVDRDGDLDMDGEASRNRGKRGRGDSGRAKPLGGRPLGRDRTLTAIQMAISSTSDSQATIRPTKGTNPLAQLTIGGLKQSKAASNRDGGLESLVAFLERRLNAPDSYSGPRARISKVCATSKLSRPPK